MNRQAQSSITEMLNAFGQTSQNYEVFLVTLGRLCAGLTDQAIIETADRFASGDVPDQSKKYPPTGPEFVEEARKRQEFIELRSRPRIAPPAYVRGALAPFEISRQKAFSKYSHLPVLVENVSFDEWRRLSATKQVPPGAIWVACLSTVYGPEAKARAA